MKRILALLLSVLFLFALLTACGERTTTDPTSTPPSNNGEADSDDDDYDGPPRFTPPAYDLPSKDADVIRYTPDGRRHIKIGTFFDIWYDSTHTDIYDGTNPTDPLTAQMEFDNLKRVEEKYNVYIEYVNWGWDGIVENIPVSIMSGWPDCDVYLCEAQFAVPAVLNGMATALEDMDIDPVFKEDLFREGGNQVMSTLKIPFQDKTYFFYSANISWQACMLGYNIDMIQAKGLEDPLDLWYAGQWTWDKFMEHLIVLTDPSQDIYGYGGFWTNFLQGMLFSNDTTFAGGLTQTMDSDKSMEVLNFIDEMYNVRKVAAPWNSADWDINNNLYREGKLAFWISFPWTNQQFLDTVEGAANLPFQLGMVPFPVGPSGNAETMQAKALTPGNYYMIPRYIKDPGEVFNIMYELHNWHGGDPELRDNMEYFADMLITERNLEIYLEMNDRGVGFDVWRELGASISFPQMITSTDGTEPVYTPASFAETFRQVLQDALDNYAKK